MSSLMNDCAESACVHTPLTVKDRGRVLGRTAESGRLNVVELLIRIRTDLLAELERLTPRDFDVPERLVTILRKNPCRHWHILHDSEMMHGKRRHTDGVKP